MDYLHRSLVVTYQKVTIKNEKYEGVLYFLLRADLALGEKTNPRRVTQEQQEIFVYDILRPMTREHLPTIMYLE